MIVVVDENRRRFDLTATGERYADIVQAVDTPGY